MPIYEYQCINKHHFELRQSMQDRPVKKCPDCGASCKRLISETSFHLKGTGWASDGYSTPGDKKKK